MEQSEVTATYAQNSEQTVTAQSQETVQLAQENPAPTAAPEAGEGAAAEGINAQETSELTTQSSEHGAQSHAFDPKSGFYIPTFNFIVFAIAAYWVFRKPLKKAMVSRKAKYLGLREDTEKLLKEAEGKLSEINKKYDSLDSDMADIVARAKATGEVEARRIIEEAHATANHIRRETERIIAHEMQTAKADLQKEIVKLAADAVQKKIETELTTETSNKFNLKLVTEITKA